VHRAAWLAVGGWLSVNFLGAQTRYQRWLDEDVGYIITDEERRAFEHLSADAQRDQFIESFWLRRDLTPGTLRNEFKEEHYRRIAYANDRFSCSRIPGWETDRGRIYIVYGPPDQLESHRSGGTYERPYEEGGGTAATFPFEVWRYRYIEAIGKDIEIEFVDPTMTGEYHLTIDRSEKDAMLYVPDPGLTLMEQIGLGSGSCLIRIDGERIGLCKPSPTGRTVDFQHLEPLATLPTAQPDDVEEPEATLSTGLMAIKFPLQLRLHILADGDSLRNDETMVIYLVLDNFQRDELTQRLSGTIDFEIVREADDSILAKFTAPLIQPTVEKRLPLRGLALAPGEYELRVTAHDDLRGQSVAQQVGFRIEL